MFSLRDLDFGDSPAQACFQWGGLVGWFVFQVALLDIDICGPSIPKMMGLEGEQVSECSNMLFKGLLNFSLTF